MEMRGEQSDEDDDKKAATGILDKSFGCIQKKKKHGSCITCVTVCFLFGSIVALS